MSDKRAFLVLGPPSSGTRLMTRLLIAAGCAGDDGHVQRWDESLPKDEPLVVMRRSVPHGTEWPSLLHLIEDLGFWYDVSALVMSRDWHSMAISQEREQYVKSVDEALSSIRRAYLCIFEALGDTSESFELVNYEALAQRPAGTVRYLFRRLGLPVPALIPDIYDGNARYYREAERVA